MWWTCGSGRIELYITKAQAARAAHVGQCDADVLALSKVPAIARQLRKIDADALRNELREYGAWNEVKLADHVANLQRILWIACGDINEREN